jgi:hypothetical protein
MNTRPVGTQLVSAVILVIRLTVVWVKDTQNFVFILKHQEHEKEHQLKPSQEKTEVDVQGVVMMLLNMPMAREQRKNLSQQVA